MALEAVKSHAPKARRKPWVAGLFSLLFAGLGHVYNGQITKGILLHCLMGLSVLAAMLILFVLPLAPLNVVGPVLMVLVLYVYLLIDAVRTARRLGDTYQPKAYNKWYVYLGAIVIVGPVLEPIVTSPLRDNIVQAFRMPYGAMENTLFVGDHFVVNKIRYRLTPPQRFDVAVFDHPWDDKHDIKRIVALPGDRVEVRDRQVYVNDHAIEEPHARYNISSAQKNLGPIVIPKKGDMIEIRQDRRVYLNGQPLSIPSGPFSPRRQGPTMTGFEVFYGPLFPAGTTLEKPTEPLMVQEDYYFTLGDNRDNTRDSRYWGFVPHANLRGLAKTIYWSWNRAVKRVRWKRIGRAIQ